VNDAVWRLYIDLVSGQPHLRFIDFDIGPQALFWFCIVVLGLLSGALLFSAAPRGMPALLWRVSSVVLLFAASAGLAILKFRWLMREALALHHDPGQQISTQMVPVLPVFLPAILLGAMYLVHLATTRHRN
jgi:hypothetical protein